MKNRGGESRGVVCIEKNQDIKMQCVVSTPISSEPATSNHENVVDMNTTAAPNLVQINLKNSALIDIC